MPIEAWDHPPTLQKVLEAKSWVGEAILHTRGQYAETVDIPLFMKFPWSGLFFPSYQVKMYLPLTDLFVLSLWHICNSSTEYITLFLLLLCKHRETILHRTLAFLPS